MSPVSAPAPGSSPTRASGGWRGLDLDLVRALTPVSAGDESDDARRERAARLVLSAVAEPGDGLLGELIGRMGAVSLLDAVTRMDPTGSRPVPSAGLDHDAAAPPSVSRRAGAARADARDRAIDSWRARLGQDSAIGHLVAAARAGAQALIPSDDEWPPGVDDLGRHAPVVLWVRGRTSALRPGTRAIALVGARASSRYGEQVVTDAAWRIAREGVTVISGGAYGIDGAAHRAALRADGETVAFLAGGVDRFYPAGHAALLDQIVHRGAVISEVPCGTAPTKWRFLQRNRLIAAASQATVVIEAGARSGSLNTAGHAAELGRPLGAVPGAVTSSHSAGCHRLLREFDATCVTDAREMLQLSEAFADAGAAVPTGGDRARPGDDEESARSRRIIDAMSTRVPRSPAELARRSGLSVGEVAAGLGALQLRGAATPTGNGWVFVPSARRS